MQTARVLAVCGLLAIGATAEATTEFALQLGVEDFRWREFDGGQRIVEESGPRLILGIAVRAPVAAATPAAAIELNGRIYFASVDYDGQACNLFGNCIPHRTDTDYAGAAGEALVVLSQAERTGWELFAGGSVDAWERDVQSRGNVSGATEDWAVMSVQGGAGWRWMAGGLHYGVRAGAKFPFFTRETLSDDDIDLEPDGQVSPFAALWLSDGGDAPRWAARLYYDSYRFDESNHELVSTNLGILEIWQPESKQDTIGLVFNLYFR